MSDRPIATLWVGGRSVLVTRAALERMSPAVLLPLADMKEPSARHNRIELDCTGCEEGAAVLYAYLCAATAGKRRVENDALLRELLKSERAGFDAHQLALKHGLQELAHMVEAAWQCKWL